MKTGETLTINTGAARNAVSNTLVMSGVTGTIAATTEKAIKLTAKTYRGREVSAWFPRKALKALKSVNGAVEGHHTVKLAHWFNGDDWTCRFFGLCEEASVL